MDFIFSLLYNIIIFPISQIIDFTFVLMYKISKSPSMALFGVSAVISLFTLPFYFIAERYQQIEQKTQELLKPKIDKIKAVFKGDEQYMILSAYYRQNHYHPVYAMRSSFGLLIQIPFFIAAYTYLSHLEILQGASFLFIRDMAQPDGILSFHNININLLPILMTGINIISGVIYTKGLVTKDKVQVYGIAILFLLLLYNSPAGLVIYWTMNNIFSLAKNIIQKMKNKKEFIIVVLFIVVLSIDFYILVINRGVITKRLLAAIFISPLMLLPFLENIGDFVRKLIPPPDATQSSKDGFSAKYFILPCVILFLLNAWVVPSSLIASSVKEFSFIGSRTTPFPFIFQTLQQGAGIFLFLPLVVYFLFPLKTRHIFTIIATIMSTTAMINVFLITENFGFLTTTMVFSEVKSFKLIPGAYIVNVLLLCIAVLLLFFLMRNNKMKIIMTMQMIIVASLFGLGCIKTITIYSDYKYFAEQQPLETKNTDDGFFPHYTLSKNGKNIVIVTIDAVVGSYVPYVFEERPELHSLMSGFRWYPNTVSFSNYTLAGALPIYGGYEYTPAAINDRNETLLLEKQQEGYLLLPQILYDSGYSIKITDPPFDNYYVPNLSIFSEYPEFNAENVNGRYTAQWLRENTDITVANVEDFLDNNLIRFSFFKSSPLFLRPFIYDRKYWFRLDNNGNQITTGVLNDYAFLDILDKITVFKDEGNTYTSIYDHLVHGTAFLQAPDYIPVENVTNKGTSFLAEEGPFHLMTASFLLWGKWFNYLRENGVYDNTRIILVSDHGAGSTDFPGNFRLSNGEPLQKYNPLLMVKDFNAEGDLQQIDTFMTNADVPFFALDGIISNPINPFTGNPLKAEKDDGVFITTMDRLQAYANKKYTYNIRKNQWLHVRDNIFDPANWKEGKK